MQSLKVEPTYFGQFQAENYLQVYKRRFSLFVWPILRMLSEIYIPPFGSSLILGAMLLSFFVYWSSDPI